jgi:hypothetical protein
MCKFNVIFSSGTGPDYHIHIFITEKDRKNNEMFEDTKVEIRSSTLKKGNNAMAK